MMLGGGTDKARIAASFGRAAAQYDRHAGVQRLAARRLAAHIAAAWRQAGQAPPRRILEIGCGSGLLTEALHEAFGTARTEWWITDLAPDMVAACAGRMQGRIGRFVFHTMDAEHPDLAHDPGSDFDLICGSLAWQWVGDRRAAAARLSGLLAPGGRLALSTLAAGSLGEWIEAQAGQGGVPLFPSVETLAEEWPGIGHGRWVAEPVIAQHADALGFLRGLRGIGAAPRGRHKSVAQGTLRTAMRRFEAAGATARYDIAYGLWRRPPRPGVFVTGTDTDIGKTLASAVIARALDAGYWKPLQTGLAEEAGDTPTVAQLAELPADRQHPPAYGLDAALSPEDAARQAGVTLDLSQLVLPPGEGALVVEGAGGVLVPIDGETLMLDLIDRLGLPVVLVARSTLGTINHTLLSLEALRRRGLAVLGVVVSGPPSPGNRDAIIRHGGVPVLLEIPVLPQVDRAAVAALADRLRPALLAALSSCGSAPPAAPAP